MSRSESISDTISSEEQDEKSDRAVDQLKDEKSELVDSIANETDMQSEEDRKIINQTLEKVYLDEKLDDKQFKREKELGNSFTDILMEGTPPSHGVAKIKNVRENNGLLEIKFSVVGTDNFFTEEYDIDSLEQNTGLLRRNRSGKPEEEFEKLVLIADARIDKPSTLIGKKVPVKPKSSSGSYDIHYPPEDPSLFSEISYRIMRTAYNHKLISYNDNKSKYETSYTPNRRSWTISVLMMITSLYIPSDAGVVIGMIISVTILSVLIAVQMAYISD